MEPQDLNMTTTVTGQQLFLFVTRGEGQPDGELAEAIDLLGRGLENVHEVDGPPSEETCDALRWLSVCAHARLCQLGLMPIRSRFLSL